MGKGNNLVGRREYDGYGAITFGLGIQFNSIQRLKVLFYLYLHSVTSSKIGNITSRP